MSFLIGDLVIGREVSRRTSLYRRSLHSQIREFPNDYMDTKTNYFLLTGRRCVVRHAWKDDGMPEFSKIRVSISLFAMKLISIF